VICYDKLAAVLASRIKTLGQEQFHDKHKIAVLCCSAASYSIVKCSCSPRTLWHFNHTRL